LTKDNSNITKTQRVIDHLRREREALTLIGEQGALILARKQLPNTKQDENTLSVEESFIAAIQQFDAQVNGILFLEEVFKSHIKIMKENDKVAGKLK
jgi:hypothetical protein